MRMLKIKQNDTFTIYIPEFGDPLEIPLVESLISAGFPSPADDYKEERIDLNKELIKHPYSTFYLRVSGHSMVGAGIFNGDLLVIDKSLKPKNNDIAVCCLNGEFTVKFLRLEENKITLVAANETYPPIAVNKDAEFLIWGIVLHAIKSFQ